LVSEKLFGLKLIEKDLFGGNLFDRRNEEVIPNSAAPRKRCVKFYEDRAEERCRLSSLENQILADKDVRRAA